MGGFQDALYGLPPLVRGARAATVGRVQLHGPTPAGAGSTTRRRRDAARCRAYPRWCGEHETARTEVLWRNGLPPLVRGAPGRERPHRPRHRPTPAGAGSTSTAAWSPGGQQTYPRWCGEHALSDFREQFSEGLPPLVREHCTNATPSRYHQGLPPLVRGARGDGCVVQEDRRPTPAGAGSTPRDRRRQRHRTAYPRWCGEHLWQHCRDMGVPGLPPLVRGARSAGGVCRLGRRPTPAGAGSTSKDSMISLGKRAYPRWCGEHEPTAELAEASPGLPPLVRGALVV